MSKRNSNRKAAPVRGTTASNFNTPNHTVCRCAKQGTFAPGFGFPPPPQPGEGPLEAYLRAAEIEMVVNGLGVRA